MISELRVRQALASSIYFDPCFPLSSPVSSHFLSLSLSHLMEGNVPSPWPSPGLSFLSRQSSFTGKEALRTLGCIS